MSHISDFKKFKLMLENNNVNYIDSTRIFETIGSSVSSVAPGAKVKDLDILDGESFSRDQQPNLFNAAKSTFGPTAMPLLRVDGQTANNDSEQGGLLNLFLRGIRQITGTDKRGGS